MPSHSAVPTRRSRDEDDDSDESESTSSSPPSSKKRPRLSAAQRGMSDDEDDQSDSDQDASSSSENNSRPENPTQAIAPRATVDGVGPGGYKPGAIVRIKVTNFVTYTSAEFFPGPKLNMVIGPNGTGKSTLVCAICLGLGWGPQHLGRAKELGEFVKHGCPEATIEIELAGAPKYNRNPVICRTIKRDGNKSSFTLNERPAPHKKVMELARSFAIQVDNLCQFLPQDKVAEFAALTPVELLHSTQRAAAGPEMVEWHGALKKLRAEQKNLEMSNRTDREVLANLENRQEMQRETVERMRQRAEIQRKIELLEMFRPVVEYREHKRGMEALEARKAELEKEQEELKREIEPATRALTSKQTYIAEVNNVRRYRKQLVEELSNTAANRGNKIEDLDASIKDLKGRIEAERKSGQKHKAEASVAQQTVNRLRRQQEEEPVEFDPDYYNSQLREKRLEKREIQTKAEEIKGRRQPLLDQERELKRSAEEATREMEHMDSQSGQQEAKLRNLSPDSLKAYHWVRENQDKFEHQVFGPVAVTCSVTDPKYADAIESLLSRNDYTAFTTQSKNDFRTLQRELAQMRFSDISIKTCTASLNSLRSPLPEDELRRLGLDGWAKDFVRGPEPVLACLCVENRFNQTPIALRDISEEAYNELENAETGGINSWVAGGHNYQVSRRREYGAKSTRVRKVQPARMWTSQPVDASLKQQYQQRIQQWKDELAQLSAKIQEERDAMAELRTANERLDKEMQEIEAEKAAKQTAYTQFRAIPEKIAQAEAKRKGLQDLFLELRDRVVAIRNEQDEIAIKKAEATIKYVDAVEEFRQAYEELMKAEILFLEATSDEKTLKLRFNDYGVMLERKSEEVKQVVTEVRAAMQKGRELVREAKRIWRQTEDQDDASEVRDYINTDDYSTVKLEADLDSERARLELTHGGSAHMIKEFEDRERQIQKLHDKLADFRTKLAALQESIDEVRGHWEPRLDALISKISDAFGDSFRRIGCAGQVSLDKVEDDPGPNGEAGGSDFEKWSIQIHVKFREHENLSLLDSHRQSGGERAVSTIFYLMALQSLSASPFRVVDEINQGMDPRNERMVHGRLVDIACASSEDGTDEDGNSQVGGGGGGQYFLITPKLLSGLVYKPGMRVLCIYSGEHMPPDYAKLEFGQAIRTMRAISRGEGNRPIESNNSVDVYA